MRKWSKRVADFHKKPCKLWLRINRRLKYKIANSLVFPIETAYFLSVQVEKSDENHVALFPSGHPPKKMRKLPKSVPKRRPRSAKRCSKRALATSCDICVFWCFVFRNHCFSKRKVTIFEGQRFHVFALCRRPFCHQNVNPKRAQTCVSEKEGRPREVPKISKKLPKTLIFLGRAQSIFLWFL